MVSQQTLELYDNAVSILSQIYAKGAKDVEALKEELLWAKTKLNELTNEKKQLTAKLAAADKNITNLQKRCQDQLITQILAQVKQAAKLTEQKLKEKEAELDNLKKTSKYSKLKEYEDELKRYFYENVKLKRAAERNNANISTPALEEPHTLLHYDDALTDLTEKLESASSCIQKLKEDIAIKEEEIGSLRKYLDELRRQLADTQATLKETAAKLKDTEGKLKDTEAKLKDTEVKLKGTEVKLTDTEAKLKGTEEKLDRETLLHQEQVKKNNELKKENETVVAQNQDLKATIEKHLSTIAGLQKDIERKSAELQEKSETIKLKDADIKKKAEEIQSKNNWDLEF
ncbi:hypothetical protein HDU96_004552 [Phlyctochytrium bullatum]|nr:hypothetical protein HDU96_004552 [Phlyctochytrium bullatum]